MRLNSALIIMVLLGFVSLAQAANTANQTVTISIDSINELATSGSPTLVIDSAAPGQAPNPVTDSSSNYLFSTNISNRKLTAQLSAAMPVGTNLEVQLTTPGGTWSSSGKKTLSTSPVTLAQGGRGYANKAITYSLSATADAGELALDTRIVTFTLMTQ